jgi:outer membrane usher protein
MATERRGLSDVVTGELHAEAKRGQYTMGISGDWRLSTLGIAHLAVAGSGGHAGDGATLGAGLEHAGPTVSYGIQGQWRTRRFLQLGYDRDQPPPRRTQSAYISIGTRRAGSASFNYTREDLPGQASLRLAGMAYNLQLGRDGYLSTSAMAFIHGGSGPLFSLTYTRLLGPRDSLNASAHTQEGARGGTLGYRHALPVDTGVGYGLQAGMTSSDPSRADLDVQTDAGTYTVETARIANQDAWRATARGSLVLLGGRVYASRHLDEGFASVEVPGFANVRIYADNQPVATTDADGFALVPRLRPYQDNPVRIEQADLPLDVRIDTLALDAVPARHSAVALRFPAVRVRSALLTLTLPDGSYVPAGAEVDIVGHHARFPVGARGEAYLTELGDTASLVIHVQGRECTLTTTLPTTADPLPHLGPLACAWQGKP